jgi:hypothetical protein
MKIEWKNVYMKRGTKCWPGEVWNEVCSTPFPGGMKKVFILTGAVNKAGVYQHALKNIGRKLCLNNQ